MEQRPFGNGWLRLRELFDAEGNLVLIAELRVEPEGEDVRVDLRVGHPRSPHRTRAYGVDALQAIGLALNLVAVLIGDNADGTLHWKSGSPFVAGRDGPLGAVNSLD